MSILLLQNGHSFSIVFKFELYSIEKKFSQNEHFVSLVSIRIGIVKFIQNKIFYFLSLNFLLCLTYTLFIILTHK